MLEMMVFKATFFNGKTQLDGCHSVFLFLRINFTYLNKHLPAMIQFLKILISVLFGVPLKDD